MQFHRDLNKEIIIKELCEAYNSENKSFDAFHYDEIKYILLSHLETSKEISQAGLEEVIETLLSKFHQEEITEDNFNNFFNESIEKYHAKELKHYTLVTSLSIDFVPYRRIKINDSIIKFHGKKFPKKYKDERREVFEKSYTTENDNDFIKVSVQTSGKSHFDAFEKAYFDLNIFRAIVCFHLNSNTEIPLSNSADRSINKVLFGKYHTLHFANSGKKCDPRIYWFETNFGEKKSSFPIDKKDSLKKIFDKWIYRINNCQESHNIKLGQVLNLYVSAFDEKDKHTCFLKGWVALENLLGTYKNDLILKRCLAVYGKDLKPRQKQIINSLKIQRNKIVHENDNRINSIVNCYHIQRLLRDIISCNNLFYWKTIKNNLEAIKLLESRNLNISQLERDIKVLSEIKKIKKHES